MAGTLLSIGDVAKLYHLSVSTLRHYEAIGLLRPERVDPDTGYRFYSSRQFEVLNTIRYLRALDLPLAEIADFLQDREVDKIEAKLRRQKDAVEEKLRELQRVRRKIDNRLRQLHEAQHAPFDTVCLEPSPPCRLLWMAERVSPKHFLDLEASIRRLEQAQPEALIFLGKVGLGLTPERLKAGQFDPYDGLFLLLDREDRVRGKPLRLPEAPCAVLRFHGSHPEAPGQYAKLMAFLQAHDLEPAGFSREITLIDNGLTNDPEKFATEIRLPVRPKTEPGSQRTKK